MFNHYRRCFISAPIGLELGVLPELLADRGISWEWAKNPQQTDFRPKSQIAAADFTLVVLNGTLADYRSVFEAGIASGLEKPILLIQTKVRALPLDFRRFTTIKASLMNRDALAFHLDLFLEAPAPSIEPTTAAHSITEYVPPQSRRRDQLTKFDSELERRVYNAVITAGGTAILQPRAEAGAKYRPDLLAWLGNIDAELLDPVVIEVRGRSDGIRDSRLEERLLSFMQTARVRTAFVLTSSPPFQRGQQLSPNVIWMTISDFENLIDTGRLSDHVRDTRNRIMHGVR